MTIASIHSAAENTAVKRLLKTVSYLGATEIKNGGSTAKHWKWDDGTKWDYAASNDGLKSGGESRVAFSTGNPQWHDWCVAPSCPWPWPALALPRPTHRSSTLELRPCCDAVVALALVSPLPCCVVCASCAPADLRVS